MLRIFMALKIPSPFAGFESVILGSMASMLTTRPPRTTKSHIELFLVVAK
jgi:hypothetical protein